MRSRDEVLTVEAINDRIRELEAEKAASEPVAWALYRGETPLMACLSEPKDSEKRAARVSGDGWRPLYSAPPSAAADSRQSVPSDYPSAAAVRVTAEVSDIAMRVRLCAGAWTPSACLIGNVTADDLLSLTGFVIECAALIYPTTPTRGSDE